MTDASTQGVGAASKKPSRGSGSGVEGRGSGWDGVGWLRWLSGMIRTHSHVGDGGADGDGDGDGGEGGEMRALTWTWTWTWTWGWGQIVCGRNILTWEKGCIRCDAMPCRAIHHWHTPSPRSLPAFLRASPSNSPKNVVFSNGLRGKLASFHQLPL